MGKEQKRGGLVLGGFSAVAFLILLTLLCSSVLEVNPLESWKDQLSYLRDGFSSKNGGNDIEEVYVEPLSFLIERLVTGDERIQLNTTGFSCQSEVCVASKPVRIDNNALTVYIPSSEYRIDRVIRPYVDKLALYQVSSVRIVAGDSDHSPPCHFTHDVPAVVFSSGGFAGNLFHEMDEIIIPLFITSRHFRSRVKFVITDYKAWWVSKYSRILENLSGFEVINPEANGGVHCFPGGVVGLKFHGFLALNSTDIPGGYSMHDFKHFLRESYNLRFNNVSEMERGKKPRLMLISRQNSRVFLNEEEMVVMMEELGFEVVRPRPNRMSNLGKFTEEVNSCSVMVGAHGAGLTNEMFLPAGAVAVQLVPLGLDWASTYYFGIPAIEMGVNYLEYKIEPEESSLVETYGRNHPIVTDPGSMYDKGMKGYFAFRAVYIDGQNLKVNIGRFRETLVQAMELIHRSNPPPTDPPLP
ncbi:hypothetical protein Ddye_027594 [Dipteronia dyeriana]|uniref:Glycosyltransferase 61 catalytic domain-containing protein n=1 Tax=Dipteronia dyeriana TaxID=168575 RepID=A0AAD9TQC6_9ROSI|nr:hypothetical protein Ddye_027594 [Dipteronia dyeriana]